MESTLKIYSDYYNGLRILSYNAIFHEVCSNRNYGKTWTFKKRAFKRGINHHKKTIWVRTFKKEVKECINSMYTSRDLQKFCGIEEYNKETDTGNFKQIGNTFYCRRGKKWMWFLKVYGVNDRNALRSVDDVDVDTIVYDECSHTPAQEKRYRGNRVSDFIDLFISAKREHQIKCIFLCNKENVINKFHSYFNIKVPPATWEGIKTYRGGSYVYEQINNLPKQQNEYDSKLKKLLQDTAYGAYLYDSKYKGTTGLKFKRCPSEAELYIQLCLNGASVSVKCFNGIFYVTNKIDVTRAVYSTNLTHKFKREFLLVKKQKQFFNALIMAFADNRVIYSNETAYAVMESFKQWLNL